jgi:nucleoside 2-deoxyribosyltransferase
LKKIYIAGPMSGYPEFNFPKFNWMQEYLEENGWKVFNPAKKEIEKNLDPEAAATGDAQKAIAAGFDFRECFTWDTQKVIEADAIMMLEGWEQSPGARAEHAVAVAMQKHYPEYKIIYA